LEEEAALIVIARTLEAGVTDRFWGDIVAVVDGWEAKIGRQGETIDADA
jgi:hypothetical protein